MNDAHAIELVRAHFESIGFEVELVPERPGLGKTPDLLLRRGAGQTLAYCEVKSPRDNWLKEQWEKAAPGQAIVGGARLDPVFNRIGRNLLKAAKQFEEYVPAAGLPAIVVLVNRDTAASFTDLIETLTGKLHLGGGKFARTRPVDPKWIAPALAGLDAVGWIDAKRPTKPLWFFSGRSPQLEAQATELLGTRIEVRI
jgi:hypothetical protein